MSATQNKTVIEEPLKKKKVAELKVLCKSLGIKVSSKAKKDDIIKLLQTDNASNINIETNTNTNIEKMTVCQLKVRCKEQNIKYNSKAKKADLISLLSKKGNDEPESEHINVEVLFYENGDRRTFDTMSGNELESVVHAISDLYNVDIDDVVYRGDDDKFMIVKNVKRTYVRLCEMREINVRQYGVNTWEKVEIKLVEDKN